MKTKFIYAITFLLSLASFNVFAETNESEKDCKLDSGVYLSDRFFRDNWFIGGGIGPSIFIGTSDNQGDFGGRIGFNGDVYFGKWITPNLGLRLEYSGGQARGYMLDADKNDLAYGDIIVGKDGDNIYKQKFGYHYIHGDVIFDLTSIISGYREDRIYSLKPYFGAGIIQAGKGNLNTDYALNVGIENSFRVSPSLDVNIDVRGIGTDSHFDTESYNPKIGLDGMFTATVGVTYTFKQRGWKKQSNPCTSSCGAVAKVENTVPKDKYDALKDECKAAKDQCKVAKDECDKALSQANKEIDDLNQQLNFVNAAEGGYKPLYNGKLISFDVNSSELSKTSKVELLLLAKAINASDSNKVYTITGYADNTGGKVYNEKLSEARALAVRDMLVNEYSVNPDKLKIDYKGAVENMFFDDPSLNRIVIVE